MGSIFSGKCRQRTFDAPSVPQPLTDCAVLYSSSCCPLRDGHRFATERQYSIPPLVVILLGHCCPSAIFRRIAKLIIDAIKGQPWGTLPHVCEEIFKNHPSVTDSYSPATIVFKAGMGTVKAPLFHRNPRIVGGRCGSVCRVSVSSRPSFVLAMTRFNISCPYLRNDPLPQFSAKITKEYPTRTTGRGFGVSHKGEAVKSGPNIQNFISRHPGHVLRISNVGRFRKGYMGSVLKSYGQPERKLAELRRVYLDSGGVLA